MCGGGPLCWPMGWGGPGGNGSLSIASVDGFRSLSPVGVERTKGEILGCNVLILPWHVCLLEHTVPSL